MKKTVLTCIALAIFSMAGWLVHGQANRQYPNPIIRYDSRLACQQHEPKMELSLKDDGSCLKVCENGMATYHVVGLDSSTFLWHVTGGVIQGDSTSTDVTILWGDAGDGMLSVTETTSDSLVNSVYLCVELVSSPTALFTIPPGSSGTEATYCIKQEIAFQDLSTIDEGAIIAWEWKFDDGSYSAEQNPTHQWSDPGFYSVSLTVYNECNCSSSYSMEITCVEGQRIEIDCPGVVCEGHTETYTALGDCEEFLWEVQGGRVVSNNNNEVTVTWNRPNDLVDGFGYLTLNSEYCPEACSPYFTLKIPVITATATIEGDAILCVGQQYQYSLPAWPATVFEWEVSNSNVAEIVNPNRGKDVYLDVRGVGSCTLSARYHNTLTGCSGQAQLTLHARDTTRIVCNEWDDGPICANTPLTFVHRYGSSNIQGEWDLRCPDGTTLQHSGTQFSHTFTQPGIYILSVHNGNYCPPNEVQIVVAEPPLAIDTVLGAREVCTNTNYFYSAGRNVEGTVYMWSAVNGQILKTEHNTATVKWDTLPAQLVVYRQQSAYPFCTSDTTTLTITSLLAANFYIESFDTLGTVTCQRSYRLMKNGVYFPSASNYEWSLLNDSAASLRNNYMAYTDVLLYNADSIRHTQLVNEFTVCKTELTDTIDVTIMPLSMPYIIGDDTVCSEEQYVFSVRNGSDYVSFEWEWDGGTASGSSATIEFSNNTLSDQTVVVHLTATTACGTKVTCAKNVVVRSAPQASITYDGRILTVHTTTICYVELSEGEDLITRGIDSVFVEEVGSVRKAVTYYCTVIDTSTGCIKKYEYTVYPTNPCHSIVVLDSVRCGVFVLGVTPHRFPSYVWEGDGGVVIKSIDEISVGCVAATAGVHTITVTGVGGLLSCSPVATIDVVVPLVADLRVNYQCDAGDGTRRLVVEDYSTSYPPAMTRDKIIQWYTNGGWQGLNPSIVTNPTPGATYHFLIKTWLQGTQDTCTKEVDFTVPPLPSAEIVASDTNICVNVPFQLAPANTTYGYYKWDLDEGVIVTTPTTERSFSVLDSITNRGVHTITLQVIDQYGCQAVDSVTIHVYDNGLGGDIGGDSIVVCYGNAVRLYHDTVGSSSNDANSTIPDYYLWQPGDATTDAIMVTTPELYTLTITDNYRCQYRMGPTGAKIIVPTIPEIIGAKDVCKGEEIVLQGLCGDSVQSYSWYKLPDTTTVIGTGARLFAAGNIVGTFTYRLHVLYASGCEERNDHTVTVHATPPKPIVSKSLLSCSPYSFQLTAGSDSVGGIYTWSNGDQGDTIVVSHGGIYNVVYMDAYGCKSRASKITVPQSPDSYSWTFPTGCYEFCSYELPRYVYGPVWFPPSETWHWTWYRDYIVQDSGMSDSCNDYGLEPPLAIDTAGSFSMMLNNGYCSSTFGMADISLRSTSECMNCDFQLEEIQFCLNRDGTVTALFMIDNPMPIDVNYVITATSPTGVYYTAQGIMLQGQYQYSHVFVPNVAIDLNTILIGCITAWYPEPEDLHCQQCFEEYVTEMCDEDDGGGLIIGGGTTVDGLMMPHDSVATEQTILLRFYPNPTSDGVFVETTMDTAVSSEEPGVIVVRNVLGQIVATSAIVADGGSIYISLGRHPAGVYMVEYRQDGKSMAVKKLIKK